MVAEVSKGSLKPYLKASIWDALDYKLRREILCIALYTGDSGCSVDTRRLGKKSWAVLDKPIKITLSR